MKYITGTIDDITSYFKILGTGNYGIKKCIEFIEENGQFEESKVGTSSTNLVDKDVRKSYISKDNIYTSSYDIHKLMNKLIMKMYSKKVYPIECEQHSFQVLKYTEGSFFNSHTDGKKEKNHICTILILPSKRDFPHQGGELEIDGDVISADEDNYKIIIFDIDTVHKVHPVISGKRYVLKKAGIVNDYFYESIFNTHKLEDFNYKFDSIEYKSHKEIEEEFNKIKNKLRIVKIGNSAIDNYNKNINSVIILQKCYNQPRPDILKGIDKEFVDYIFSNLKNAKYRFSNVNISSFVGETEDGCDMNIYDGLDYIKKHGLYRPSVILSDINVNLYSSKNTEFYMISDTTIRNNSIIESEYNDETYDNYMVYNATVLFIET